MNFSEFAKKHGILLSLVDYSEQQILETAITASKRKKGIENFIKCAFKKTVISEEDAIPDRKEVANCDHGDMALTQQELATLFGQKQDSPILRRIFDTLDTGKVDY